MRNSMTVLWLASAATIMVVICLTGCSSPAAGQSGEPASAPAGNADNNAPYVITQPDGTSVTITPYVNPDGPSVAQIADALKAKGYTNLSGVCGWSAEYPCNQQPFCETDSGGIRSQYCTTQYGYDGDCGEDADGLPYILEVVIIGDWPGVTSDILGGLSSTWVGWGTEADITPPDSMIAEPSDPNASDIDSIPTCLG